MLAAWKAPADQFRGFTGSRAKAACQGWWQRWQAQQLSVGSWPGQNLAGSFSCAEKNPAELLQAHHQLLWLEMREGCVLWVGLLSPAWPWEVSVILWDQALLVREQEVPMTG